MLNVLKANLLAKRMCRTTNLVQHFTHKRGRTPNSFIDYENINKLSVKEWKKISDKLLQINTNFTVSMIMNGCTVFQNISLADSFMEYIKSDHESLIPITQAHYLQVLRTREDRKNDFINLYDHLIENNPDDANVVRIANKFNYLFKKSRKSLKDILYEEGVESAVDYLIRSHRKKNPKDFWDKILIAIENQEQPKGFQLLKKILIYISKKHHKFFEGLPDILLENSHLALKSSAIVNMLNDVPCTHCNTSLVKTEMLTEKDVKELKDSLENDVVKGPSIYMRSSPEEWTKFKKFLHYHGKFDVIVDGLNFSYKSDNYSLNTLSELNSLGGSKFLYIGRQYVPNNIIDIKRALDPKKKFVSFMVDHQSSDDLFTIYAALHSGLGTKLVSNDYLRQHKKFSDLSLIRKFNIWQRYHQIVKEDDHTLKRCSLYEKKIHFDGAHIFHIPMEISALMNESSRWMCLTINDEPTENN